jgi:hypothetical protein
MRPGDALHQSVAPHDLWPPPRSVAAATLAGFSSTVPPAMPRTLPLSLLLLAALGGTAHAAPTPITIEQAMADPDWIGPPVESAWWSWNSQQVEYQLKRTGSPVRDTFRKPRRPDPRADVLPGLPGRQACAQGSKPARCRRTAAGLLVVTARQGRRQGPRRQDAAYVTESGYEESDDERTRVGRNDPEPHALKLVDLAPARSSRLSLRRPARHRSDPLAALRAAASSTR